MIEPLRLDANEGPPPSVATLEALTAGGAESLRRYPDARALEAEIAGRLGHSPERVLVTAGADDAIDRCCRAFLGAGRRLLMTEPAFEMIERFALLAHAEVDRVPWAGGPFPVAAMLAARSRSTGLIAVVSPANPTGAVLSRDELLALARGAAGTPLLLDHVYAEFADEDLTETALEFPGAVVIRSLSKAWGLAGCRVGYALAAPDVIGRLRSAGAPFPVAGPSLLAARARLDRGGVEAVVTRVRGERTRLTALLERCGAATWPSQANFVLAGFDARADFVRDALRALGVLVRDCSRRPHIPGALRLGLPGDEAAFQRLCRALELVLKPEALLFDLDGVLADVSQSYRTCIALTAASFGLRVSADDIARCKARGNANDDWQLTRELITGAGIEAPIGEVVRRFQQRYLGTADQPGLRLQERWLPAPGLLERLAARLPLAIVTGRPRAEAEWLLGRSGVRALFAVLVTREDAPLKPDAAPVRLALEQLGVRRAWLIGDTPDDTRAALAAGALPLSVAADPGAVLTSLDALENLWT